jgi:hypothetical protein
MVKQKTKINRDITIENIVGAFARTNNTSDDKTELQSLTYNQRVFIITRLAMFKPVELILKQFYKKYKLTISSKQVKYFEYSEKYSELLKLSREKYLASLNNTNSISHKELRKQRLEKLYIKVMKFLNRMNADNENIRTKMIEYGHPEANNIVITEATGLRDSIKITYKYNDILPIVNKLNELLQQANYQEMKDISGEDDESIVNFVKFVQSASKNYKKNNYENTVKAIDINDGKDEFILKPPVKMIKIGDEVKEEEGED